jgi:hypothetical protein
MEVGRVSVLRPGEDLMDCRNLLTRYRVRRSKAGSSKRVPELERIFFAIMRSKPSLPKKVWPNPHGA